MNLKVVTLNCWGLPDVITKRVYCNLPQRPSRTERMLAIAHRLHQFDIVALQEMWIQQDRDTICKIAARDGLKHHHYFKSFGVGSGLMVVSRFPIVEAQFFSYSLNGKPPRIGEGDYYAGKGLGLARINCTLDTSQQPLLVDMFVTHTIAEYGTKKKFPWGTDEHWPHRISQAHEVVETIKSKGDSSLVLLMGDLNTNENLEYSIIMKSLSMKDAIYEIHPKPPGKGSHPQGATCEMDAWNIKAGSKRLDYILIGKNERWKLLDAKVVFKYTKEKLWGDTDALDQPKPFMYSDHLGVYAAFQVSDSASNRTPHPHNVIDDAKEVAKESLSVLTLAVKHAYKRAAQHSIIGLLMVMLAVALPSYLVPFGIHDHVGVKAAMVVVGLYGMLRLLYVVFFKVHEVRHLKNSRQRIHRVANRGSTADS